jgi:putative ABC transport system ATP-binding protein
MPSIVSIRDATKSYNLGKVVVPALRGVSLEIEAGEFMSIAGPSGSGKTTLLNLIGCVDVPTSGSVHVDGNDISKLSERELTSLRLHTIGFIFQSFNLVNVLDVYRNVELPLLLQRVHKAEERKTRVMDLLTKVGLRDFIKHRPSELSGGQRQRVAIARALVSKPKLVLADEPTANLDSVTRELNQEQGTTFVFSTHDARVMAHAQRIVRLADGKLAAAGSPEEAAARDSLPPAVLQQSGSHG